MADRWGKNGNSDRLYFLGLQNHLVGWLQPWNLKMLAPWKRSYYKPREHIKNQRHHFADKGLSSQSYVFFPVIHVWIWELDHKEGWAPKNWCFWIVGLEKALEISLGSKETKPVNPKRNHPWIFIGRETEQDSVVLMPPPPGSMFPMCLFFHGKLQKQWKNKFNQGNEKCRNKEKQSKETE